MAKQGNDLKYQTLFYTGLSLLLMITSTSVYPQKSISQKSAPNYDSLAYKAVNQAIFQQQALIEPTLFLTNAKIFEAIKSNDLATLRQNLKKGQDINQVISIDGNYPSFPMSNPQKMVNIIRADGFTALHLAALWGQLRIVKFLLFQGARINQGNHIGYTALHLASQEGHVEVVEFLLQSGARINQGTANGFAKGSTALHIAVENQRISVVRKLLENQSFFNSKIDIHRENLRKESAISLALKNKNMEIHNLLVNYAHNIK